MERHVYVKTNLASFFTGGMSYMLHGTGVLHDITVLARSLDSVSFIYIPRLANVQADSIAKAALLSLSSALSAVLNINGMENPPPTPPLQIAVTIYMQYIPQRIHQLLEEISVCHITVCIRSVWDIRKHQTDNTQICIGFLCYDHHGQLLEGRLTGNIQPNDSKNLTEGDIYEFSGFSVIHNSRHRKLTQLPYYIQIDQKTITLNVTVNGPIFPVHNLSPQNYRNLLRLATTPTYLPGK
ncbi:hypothetical protein YC2023_084655 [Brassica napus]